MGPTFNLHGIEIFSVGQWNGDPYTERDLADMVDAFNQLDFKPPLKAGHSEREPSNDVGAPALGWIENLRLVGGKLIADFTHMPKLVYEAIRDRRYDNVSAEIYWDLERAGKKFRRALKALSILGAEPPAVAGLRPLHEYFTACWPSSSAKFAYSELPSGAKAYGCELHSEDDSIVKKPTKGNKMDVTKEQFDALQKQLSDLTASNKAAQDAADARAKAAEDELKAYKERAEADRKARDERLASLEAERRTARLNSVAESCKIPSLRPFVKAFADVASLVPGTKTYDAAGKESDADKVVSDMIAELNKLAATHLFSVVSTGGEQRAEGEESNDPGKELDKRIRELRAKDKALTYAAAQASVLAADPALKAAYARPRAA